MSQANPAEPELRVETTDDSAVLRTVRVEVPEAQVREAFDAAFKRAARGAQVKGFRRGKVPRKVIERVYAAAAAEEVERVLVQATLPDALELADVQPVTEPTIDAKPPESGAPFEYSARVEIKPVIELPKLAGLSATRPKVEVDESAVAERLEGIRGNFAPLVEVAEGEAAADGDTINVDFVGRVDGEEFEGGSAEDLPIELGSKRMIPGFEEQLAGAVAGEERQLSVTFPEDYGAEDLAGKDATFDVTVRTIKRQHLPELDDEFAKDVGEDSLEALQAKLRKDLEEQEEKQARGVLRSSLMDALIERCDFEVPPGLVERQLQSQVQSMQQQFQGRVAPEVLQQELSRIYETGRDGAERRVREALLLDAVVRANELAVDDAAIDAKLDEIAAGQGTDTAMMRKMAEEQGWRQSIEAELLDDAALDFLASVASVEETTGT